MKKTFKTLLCSVLALLMTLSAFVGTTFAWFTDTVSSGNNIITAGNLDLEVYWTEDIENPSWNDAEDTAAGPIFDYDNWEPGYALTRYVKIANEGSLSFKYALSIIPDGEVSILADVIDVYFVENATKNIGTRDDLNKMTPVGTLRDVIDGKVSANGVLLPEGETKAGFYSEELVIAIALKMREEAGNEYMNKSIGDSFSIRLVAAQYSYESDSFTNDYDSNATFPEMTINYSAATSVENIISNGALSTDVTVGDTSKDFHATVPAGVTMANGADNLTLSINSVEESSSNANLNLTENEKALILDVHMEGVAEDNTVPMNIVLKGITKKGLNDNNIKLYHVEDGVTVQMTSVSLADLDAHNEFYYDAATGDIILSLASFSDVALVTDDGHWTGVSATEFNKGSGTEADPYIIANASQLAYFRDLVDGGNTFAGQYVALANDIILNHHDEAINQFNPIGYGYDFDGYTVDGKTFNGTFDGKGHAIHGLLQNGWTLESMYAGEDYTYSMAGGGLFASVVDATIKNLTLKHAQIVMECVDMGILVGYSQGTCTYENIYIYHSTIANYQRATGGVVGEVSPQYDKDGNVMDSQHNFINVNVGSSCTVGTLWGDFDAPCGGVIGAKWDSTTTTRVTMTDVNVSCVLDVYNDVTSAYQWYAYRRAGMLIGNTEEAQTTNGRTQATASFLTCTDCVVIYDDWRNYTYCEFTNDTNPGKNYPWVRVEPGLNCSSYSNPRYGHPIDAAGNSVIDDLHVHQVGDDCTTLIQFNQLYGGGQGVYGAPTHAGVSEGKYTITFIGADGDVADVKYITGETATTIEGKFPDIKNAENKTPLAWEDAKGTAYATFANGTWGSFKEINAGNLVDIVLYPEWPNEYNIYFVDHNGKVLYYEAFTVTNDSTKLSDASKAKIEAARKAIQIELDNTEKVIHVKWDKVIDNIDFKDYKNDITVKIELELSTTSITLTPHYNETTGQLTNYTVSSVNISEENKSVSIPSHVGHVPVTGVDSEAFDGFDNLTAVRIPTTVTSLGAGMFPGSNGWLIKDLQTVTIYYDGDINQWNNLVKESHEDWDDTLGDGSRVFFLTNGKVDASKGFVELFKGRSGWTTTYEWLYHEHAYVENPTNCEAEGHYKTFTDYTAEGRPDRDYWITETTSAE